MAKEKLIDSDKLLSWLEKYREQLYETKTISPTKFSNMQSAIHVCKAKIHEMRGTKMTEEERIAWAKN